MNEKQDSNTLQMPFMPSIGSTEYESGQTQLEFAAALMKLDRFMELTPHDIETHDNWRDNPPPESPYRYEL